jgi:GNAT superfamily N-acetyltransferase
VRARGIIESAAAARAEGLAPGDEVWAESRDDGTNAACAVWWRGTPPLAGHRVGLVGHYRAGSEATGAAVLSEACRLLAGRGCTLAVGPMDGSTWHRYRLVTDPGTRPPFFLEPDTPPEWPGHFTAAGFKPLATYYSAMTPPLDRLTLPQGLPAGAGIVLRPLDLDDYESEMRRLHGLSLACFRENLLFTPIGWAEFAALYRPLRPHLRNGLSWIAESGRATAGFAFGVPDLLQARREGTVDTVILKTLATRPDLRGNGLGHALAARCLRAAMKRGYRHLIFALIREGNPSGRIVARYARPIRSYLLFARELGTP